MQPCCKPKPRPPHPTWSPWLGPVKHGTGWSSRRHAHVYDSSSCWRLAAAVGGASGSREARASRTRGTCDGTSPPPELTVWPVALVAGLGLEGMSLLSGSTSVSVRVAKGGEPTAVNRASAAAEVVALVAVVVAMAVLLAVGGEVGADVGKEAFPGAVDKVPAEAARRGTGG